AGTPSDTEYGQQWALPKIGWDSVYGSVNPAGSATIAVLDTGVDGSHPDLAGRVGPGWSAFAGSNPAADANGHGTALAGIAAVDYAWSPGAVVVAATGNDGSSAVTYPAGDAHVVGVSATDQSDALWSGSNRGQDTFLGAPGVGVAALAPGGGTTSITGTSASAAIVAGSAALLIANDPGAANDVIIGRLARNADP